MRVRVRVGFMARARARARVRARLRLRVSPSRLRVRRAAVRTCARLAGAEDVARAVAGRKGEGVGAVRLSKARLTRVSSRPARGLLV